MKQVMIAFVALVLMSGHADEAFMYGKASGSGKSVTIELKLELCSNPPSPMTFVFDDGSLNEGVTDKKNVVLKNKRGSSKELNIESYDGKFKAVDCEVKYTLNKDNSSKAIFAIANSKKIEVKKIKDWKTIPYEKLDKEMLLNAKPLENMREQMRIRRHLGTELCSVEWSMEKEGLVYGKKEKSKHRSIRIGAPVLSFKDDCIATAWRDFMQLYCKSPENSGYSGLSFVYMKNRCVSVSFYGNLNDVNEDFVENGIWGEIKVDDVLYYVIKQDLSDNLPLRDIYLFLPDGTGIYSNYLTPIPPTILEDG